jgi:hypothetical protein
VRDHRESADVYSGTDDRLDTLLAGAHAQSLAAQPRPNGAVTRISGANPG